LLFVTALSFLGCQSAYYAGMEKMGKNSGKPIRGRCRSTRGVSAERSDLAGTNRVQQNDFPHPFWAGPKPNQRHSLVQDWNVNEN